jgi:PAS domain S-box-containing protein
LATVQMLGYPRREDLLRVITGDLFADRSEAWRARELADRDGVLRDFESRFKRHDGRIIWADYTAHAVLDEEGQPQYYEGSIQDITKRKRAEEELRQSEERYRTLFDGVPVGLYRLTGEGQILDANLATVQMLGYPSREALLATNMTDVFVRPREAVRGMLLADRKGIVRDYETRLRREDGSVIWVNYTARSVRNEDGQVLYYEGSLEDITHRKTLEEEIRRQKEYFEALFVGSPAAAMTTDLDGNIASWNPMAEKLFGYTQEEAVGQNIDDLVARDPTLREEARGYTARALSKERVRATARRTRKDGSLVDVEVSALPVTVGDGHVGFVAIYHDIGELQQARRAAEEANQAKSVFLANMSHELRTPLNAILGFSQLMEGDPNLTAEQQENLGIINLSGEHLLALINDVLEMSKIEAGRLTLEETSFDLYLLLDSLEEMFRLRAREKGLDLTFRREADLPRYIQADEAKLRQILSNLLGNAVKFTREGGVVLSAKHADVKSEAQDAGTAEATDRRSRIGFEVEDTGPGIPPAELQVIFEPFMQATTGQPQEGTGLGLAISRQFARMMGGKLRVRSELDKGSLFCLDLPVGLASDTEAVTGELRRRVVGMAPGQEAPDGGPFRLLVAEDRETNRRLLVRLLEPLGFAVREASDGQEAIEVWEAWRPHLIWMDMRMPVMDGCQATRHIKALPGGQETVIVALTATAFEEERERILLEGCDDFVRKPFRKEELFEVLARYLGVRFVYEEEAPPAVAKRGEVAAPAAEALLAGALAALPAAWRDGLRQATVRADLSEILAIVDEIRPEEPALADALDGLAQGFDYPRILALLDEVGD